METKILQIMGLILIFHDMTQKIYDLFYLFSRFLFLIDKIETKILSIYEIITHQKCPLTLMENYFRVN